LPVRASLLPDSTRRIGASDEYNEAQCLRAAGADTAQTANCQRAFGKPADSLYSYGASVGGPIVKKKLFFYSALERYTFSNTGIGALSSTVSTTKPKRRNKLQADSCNLIPEQTPPSNVTDWDGTGKPLHSRTSHRFSQTFRRRRRKFRRTRWVFEPTKGASP